jgi:hypothetical protein
MNQIRDSERTIMSWCDQDASSASHERVCPSKVSKWKLIRCDSGARSIREACLSPIKICVD